MTYYAAVESRLPKSQVYALGESIAKQMDFEPGGDVYELTKRLGGRVDIEDTLLSDSEHTGSLYVNAPNDFQIIVPSHTSLERDRFTVAHELGHYVLHYLWQKRKDPAFPDRVMAFRRGSERIEWEANWFAAALLMPETEFRHSYATNKGDLTKIASEFRVSTKAAEVRVKGLNLL